jgi:hypothetical protein
MLIETPRLTGTGWMEPVSTRTYRVRDDTGLLTHQFDEDVFELLHIHICLHTRRMELGWR